MNIELEKTPAAVPAESQSEELDVVREELLPPVNEFKRFVKVFFKRKVVFVGFVLVVLMLLMAVFAGVIAPYGPYDQDLHNVLAAPGGAHLLGTDALGRDLLSRIIYGSRVALSVGIFTVLVSAAVGTLIGLIAGYAEGAAQVIIMRLTDAMMSIPNLVFSIIIVSLLRAGVPGVVLAIAFTLLPGYIRLVNGQVMSVKQNDYVMAERSMGTRKARILFRHILPNCLSPLIVQMTMMMGVAILQEASLSFLGLGILPPTAAWGSLCYDGYKYLMMRPLLSIAPGLAIMILVFAFNMVGDGLRDALDPKLRGTSSN
ncbi:peptide/nickel transport system permease protein [Sporobacter termitidis DSM 10068]|uniref:Peptide/nickel transport system permease protein n=1 Tax=Sporobacter termitidis DSM 10068 TaxID=1123282 RepID=A0A1M5Z098_9FIRM|nr:ABC transporter permease [Sporobacter termitidis]SHI17488.1 peptide/nickel transport system permease protein [Sporobacter termitidis DSM 10068]